MGRFLFWTTIFLVTGGFILHFEVNIPFVSLWLGKLPGDFVVHNNKIEIYFPIVSAAIVSFVFSFIFSLINSLFTKKREK